MTTPQAAAERLRYQKTLDQYLHFFETLSVKTMNRLDHLVTPSIHFSDPFNTVSGPDKMKAALGEAFTRLKKPSFKVRDVAWGQRNTAEKPVCYLKWDFSWTSDKDQTTQMFSGLSEIYFDPETTCICAHIDYWDSATHVYMRVPILGSILRRIRQKLAVK